MQSYHSRKRGLPPGTVEFFGERRQEQARITLFRYDAKATSEEESVDIPSPGTGTLWLNIDGLHDTDIVKRVGDRFSIHPLALEDIVSPNQRPKLDEYTDMLFIVVRMLTYDERLHDEQVSFVLTRDALVTFQEQNGDVFEPVRRRLRERQTRIATLGADYLMYALIDAVIDNYFVVLESFSERIEELESEAFTRPQGDTLRSIQSLKRDLIRFRRAVWPLREVISTLSRDENDLISEHTHRYLRDAYDHCVQVIDTVESLRETTSGLLDIYLTNINTRISEVMKVLTIIATIFIPLTFIAGVYGMNFVNMPELEWEFGYFIVLGLMASVTVVMLAYFKRRGWV